MSDNYLVELKDSVFRETTFTKDDFDRQIEFSDETDAEKLTHDPMIRQSVFTCLT
jgi:hypothetical protein